MNISEALHLGADHIQKFGHIKGVGHGRGSVMTAPSCVIGALNIATLEEPAAWSPAISAVASHVGGNVVSWNDAPERTAAEVIETLRACAVIEAAKESTVATVMA